MLTNFGLFRATTEDVDYLENQCADSRSYGMCDYQEYPESDLGFGDLQITARSKDEVRESEIIELNFTKNFVKLKLRSLFTFPECALVVQIIAENGIFAKFLVLFEL